MAHDDDAFQPDWDEIAQKIRMDPQIPDVYANTFITSGSSTDALMIFQLDGRPLLKLRMGYAATKTFVERLSELVEKMEEGTGQRLLSLDELNDLQERRSWDR